MGANNIWKFIERYKILHILFWAYSISANLHERVQFYGGTMSIHLPLVILIKAFQAMSVYVTLLYLMPVYLNQNKYMKFFSLLTVLVISCGLGTAMSVKIYNEFAHRIKATNYYFMSVSLIVDIVIMTFVFIAATVIYNRYRNDQLNRKTEKERLETELSFLKAQINPHFLFNAINSIYVLIDIDKQQASETLLKFSGMLRYQLYECNDDKIEIDRELTFISDYVGIETLRKEENLQVDYSPPVKMKYLKLPPFLLMPFVENAFKHVSKNNSDKNFISIDAKFVDHSFQFHVSNSYHETANNNKGGIGLQNVKRRLELLFPNKHQLNIEKKDNIHTIMLTLNVN